MSEHDGNGGNGALDERIARSSLVDDLTITFDRADGTMKVGGRVVNYEVALTMCERAARHFETLLRVQAAGAAQQAIKENARVAAIIDRTRGGRG